MLRYDIHGLVKVDSNVRPGALMGVLPPIFISGRGDGDADISVFAGDFTYDGSGIYYEGPFRVGPLRSKFLLDGLEGKARIWFLSPRYRFFGEVKPEIRSLIFEVLEIKLLQRGHTLIHAACLEKDGEGIMLVAPPDTGKTFTSIRLVRRGFNFMADDMTILGPEARAYCFPTPMTIHLVHLRELDLPLPRSARASVRARWLLNSLPWVKKLVSEARVDYRQVLKDIPITRRTRVAQVFFLERGPRGLEKIDEALALSKLIPVAKMHRSIFDDLITIYSYYHPELDLGSLARRQEELYGELVEEAECYIVRAGGRRFADVMIEEGMV